MRVDSQKARKRQIGQKPGPVGRLAAFVRDTRMGCLHEHLDDELDAADDYRAALARGVWWG